MPPHELYGTVRDELGNPLTGSAEVIFEGTSGLKRQAPIGHWTEPGVNFRLSIPLEADFSEPLTIPTALRPNATFRLQVRIGRTTYLPIEMSGNLSAIGAAGGRTRIDLTLGEDTDGNGLPDAWERAVARRLGLTWAPGSIDRNAAYPGSGMTYCEVYLAGTYTVNPAEGFALAIRDQGEGPPALAFTAVKGRFYSIETSSQLGEWHPISFRIVGPASGSPPVELYQATDTRRVEAEVPSMLEVQSHFFRLMVH